MPLTKHCKIIPYGRMSLLNQPLKHYKVVKVLIQCLRLANNAQWTPIFYARRFFCSHELARKHTRFNPVVQNNVCFRLTKRSRPSFAANRRFSPIPKRHRINHSLHNKVNLRGQRRSHTSFRLQSDAFRDRFRTMEAFSAFCCDNPGFTN
ncbi:hypothetical protein TcasGA2_TC009357 [Tribolium castaneum]|uniref:Uncharacterized protein n=1 Tax=Tribolium castaneum TaxID=7070 RepID=D6WRC7_TRICA|nr:hypothetical protein TcasGA2_TC009357 [Tribolium castaneum]